MSSKIVAFGEVMMRLEVPSFKKLSQANTLHYIFSGTGVNVLSGLSNLGYQAQLLSKVPEGSLGKAALSYIRSLGIDTSFVGVGDQYIGMYFLEQGFDVRSTKVTYTNRKESSFSRSTLKDYSIDQALENARVIHLCGISLAVTDNVRQIVMEIARKAKKRGILVCFDCNYRPSLWNGYEEAREWYSQMLSLTDICFMGEKDAMCILGMETKEKTKEAQIEDLLPKVAEEFNISHIGGTIRDTFTMNHYGLKGYYIAEGDIVYSSDYKFEALDRIGTGDAYTSGIIHGILSGWQPRDIVEFSTASAVYAHTTFGDSPIASEDEIMHIVQDGAVGIQR